MALSVITLQDEADGTVSLSFTTDPQILSEEQEISDGQILAMMAIHQVMSAINEDKPVNPH